MTILHAPVRLLGAACALVMALGAILNGGAAPPQEPASHALESLGFRPEPASAGTPGLDVLGWRTRFAELAAIEFREVQPGTDLVLRGSGSAMEALIAVAPSASPSSLVLTVPAGLRMGVDGAAEGVHDGTPVRVMATFYQTRGADLVRVAGGLLLSSDQLTFWAERTEKGAPLVVSLRATFGAAAPIDSAVQSFGPGAATLTALLLTDADSNSQVTPGDTLRYRLTIPNAGAAIPNVVATIPLSVYHTSVPGTLNVSPFALDLADTTAEDVPLPLVLAGTDAEGQVLTYTIVTPPAHGAVVPASPGSGSVTYTPEADYHGPDSFTYSVNDGRLDSNEVGTVTLTVTPRNDAPSFTKGADVTVNENSGAHSQPAWATAISAGGPDEAGQTLTFNVTGNTNAALFSVAPAVAANGTLTFTPATDANGSATITLTLSDDGGTANGGADTSAPQTFLITVSGVNAAPSFTKGADQTVLEDAGAQTAPGWATAIDPGAGESGQTLTFQITNNTNAALFSSGPAVSGTTGDLTYTPAANANGTATITLRLMDNGGTANGGVDVSPTQTFVINVTAVNDAPGFTKGADVTVLENSGAFSQTLWATALSAGPANESAQTLSFVVTNNTNAALFSGAPAVASNGDLTFTPAADASGSATITLRLDDNGGTADGGVNQSATQTFEITVSGINSAPSFTKGADQTVNEDAGAQTASGWATAIDPGAGESGQVLTFEITNNTNTALFSALPAVSGTTGDLTYTPAANANGTATITLRLTDDGGTANGGVDASATQTFVINVTTVNDAPSFTKGADVTVLEESGVYTQAGWATAISAGPADEAGQTVSFTVTNNTNAALFSVGPAIASNGTLTFTPAGDAFGAATITLRADDDGGVLNGGVNQSATQSFLITVDNINDAPSFTKGADQTVNEDAAAQTVNGWATAIDPGPGETGQVLTFEITNNTNAALFSAAPVVSGTTGDLTYTPAANANGTATITLRLTDDGGTDNGGVDASATQTFVINVTTVNDAPSFTKGTDITVPEDAGNVIAPNWATARSRGPADEAGQTLTFVVTNNTNAALFSVAPAVNGTTGTLTFTAPANANGTATITLRLDDNGGTANGGVDQSPTQTFVITVTSVNDTPSFTKGADQVLLEDATAVTVNGWATAISAGPNESDSLTFNVGNDNNALFSAGGQPAVGASGTLTYTLAANQSGLATVSVSLTDDASTPGVPGDDLTSAAQTFTITVTAVNDAPGFTAGANQTVAEDSASQTVPGWATGMSAGPADESAQTLTFSIQANDHPEFFAAAPSVASNGTLTYTPSANEFGTANITVRLTDTGGTANSGVDFVDHALTITLTAVNDPPTFSGGANQSVNEDAPATSTPGFLTAISPGPNESGQTVSFVITGNTNSALFSTQPAIGSTGTLSFTAAANQNGVTTITYHASDNGGVLNGGDDTTDDQTFTITLTAINDAPTVTAKNYVAHTNMPITTAAGAGLLSGVTDNDSGVNGCTPAFTVTNVSATTPAGGVVTPTASTGAFDFTPPPGATGNVTFTYQVQDNGCPGTVTSAAVTVTFNVTGPTIWFVDDGVAGGNGTMNAPFQTLAHAAAVDTNNHRVFVYSGTYATGFTLNTGEWLVGQAAPGASFDALLEVSPPAGTATRPSLNGAAVILQSTVTAASDTFINGIAISTAVTGFVATSVTNFRVVNTTVSSTGGTAISASAATPHMFGATFDSTTSGGGLNGIVLADVAGIWQFGSGALTNNTTAGFALTNSAVNAPTITYSGTINPTAAGRPVDIGAAGVNTGLRGGSVTFSGTIGNTSGNHAGIRVRNSTAGTLAFVNTVNGASSTSGVTLATNTGATVTFQGGLTLSTSTGPAFSATGGGTVSVCDDNPCNPGAVGALVNTITTNGAVGLNVNGTTIGANGLEFRTVSASNAANGIVLIGTGAGGLRVNGDGSNTSLGGNGSGGTIATMSGANGAVAGSGIYLDNVSNIVLRRLTINGTNQNFGIRGFRVNNLTLEYMAVGGLNGNDLAFDNYGEGSVMFGDDASVATNGLTGSATVTSSLFSGGASKDFSIVNTAGTLNRITITGSTFGLTQNLLGGQNLLMEARNAGTIMNATVTGTSFLGAAGDNSNFTGQTGTTMDVVYNNNVLTNTHPQNTVGSTSLTLATQGIMTFIANNNTMRGANGSAVTLQKASAGTLLSGTFNGNTIGVTGIAGSGSATGNGLFFSFAGGGTITLAVTNNQIRRYNGNAAIYADNTGGTYDVNLTLTGNVTAEGGGGAFAGLALAAGSPASADDIDVCAKIGGAGAERNNFSDGDPANANDFILGVSTGASSIRLPGYAGTTLTDVQNFVFANNNFAGTVGSAYTDAPATAANFTGGAACAQPLLAADGEAPATTMATALKAGDVGPALLAARTLWRKTGLSTEERGKLESIAIELTDLPGALLGEANGASIALDRTAAGWGWFVDPTPNDDDEFGKTIAAEAADRIDLVTVLVHEIGHVLGRPDVEAKLGSDDIMTGTLARGVRRAPIATRTTKLLPTETLHTPSFTFPAARTATVIFDAGIDVPFKASVGRVSAHATITGDGVSTIVSDDPSTGALNDPTVTLVQCPGAACTASMTSGDFNGDGVADIVVYRPSNQTWYVRGQMYVQYGEPGDMPVPADYNGDGITDIAVYRPSTGQWLVRNQFILTWGDPGDLPVPADYDHDGAADLAVYRRSTGQWFVRNQFVVQFGDATDIPIPADYNGDGTVDVAVYRPGTGYFYVRNQFATQYGGPGYVPVVADYDGNGTADIAVYLPSTGFWFVRDQIFVQHGAPGDVPMPRDFDGDGDADVAVYRPSTGHWVVRNQFDIGFGDPGDVPVPRGPQTGHALAGDYTSDRRTDFALYRPSTGQWLVRNELTVQFGDATDVPVPADYTGDGRIDIAVYRPSTGQWFVRNLLATTFGPANATPVPGDYNGDGLADVAVFVSATGEWRVRNQFTVTFGQAGDIPAPGDYDGDGITDIAVYRPSTGQYLVRNYFTTVLGQAGDVPVPGDYNRDGILDAAVYRPSTGEWFIRGQGTIVFGAATDTAVPGDFNGDGLTDLAVYRPSTGQWFVRNQSTVQYGDPADVPVVRIGRPQ